MSNQPLTQLRTQKDYKGLSRSVAANHFRTEVKKAEAKADAKEATGEITTTVQRKLNLLKQFTTATIWQWLKYYVVNRFGPKADYATYTGADRGIYSLQNNGTTTIGVIADWATFTLESIEMATKMKEQGPDYTVHMGDTYYVGEPKEIAANFLGNDSPWPRGPQGSFVLLGNHEMYARGIAYYEKLLPAMGRNNNGTFSGQGAAFFCLENEHWRILGLDTGYHSIGKIPLLEMISFLTPNCRFDDKLMQWLKDDVRLGNADDKRGLVVLTHHQYLSAFKGETEYKKPAEQLASFIGKDRPVVWLFGHEHKFSMYEKAQLGNGVTAWGRCIGHGGMPIELKGFKQDSGKQGFSKLAMVDTRETEAGSGLGFNGYALLRLNGDALEIEYRDKNGALATERWLHSDVGIKGSLIQVSEALRTESFKEGKQWN